MEVRRGSTGFEGHVSSRSTSRSDRGYPAAFVACQGTRQREKGSQMRQRFATSALFVLALVLIFVPAATTAVGVDSTAYRNAVTAAGDAGASPAVPELRPACRRSVTRLRRDGLRRLTQSVDYVAQQMTAAATVLVQPFTFDRFEETAPPVPAADADPADACQRDRLPDDGLLRSGNITNARLVAAGGIVIPSPAVKTSGCTAADFNGFPASGRARPARHVHVPWRRRRTRRTQAPSAS